VQLVGCVLELDSLCADGKFGALASLSMKTHVAQEGEPVLVTPQDETEVLNAELLRTFVPPIQAPSQVLAPRIGIRNAIMLSEVRWSIVDGRPGDSWNSAEYHATLWRKATANGDTMREEISPSKSTMTNSNVNANRPSRGTNTPSIIEAGFFCALSKSVGSRNPLDNRVEFLEHGDRFVDRDHRRLMQNFLSGLDSASSADSSTGLSALLLNL
jgi:hypothetical protein